MRQTLMAVALAGAISIPHRIKDKISCESWSQQACKVYQRMSDMNERTTEVIYLLIADNDAACRVDHWTFTRVSVDDHIECDEWRVRRSR
jgi:hypothetical protein